MSDSKPVIAVLGGTGALGGALALRWAAAGRDVVIGSRRAESAAAAAAAINAKVGREAARGLANPEATAAAAIVVMAVPHESHAATLASVAGHLPGKVFVDTTVPLVPGKVRTVNLPEGGSVAKAAQAALGDAVRVVSAFQSVAAHRLADLDETVECDVLVTGNDQDARQQVVELAEAAGLRGWHAGRIDNAVVAESLTPVLIFLNGRYGIDGAGIRITGTPTKG